MTTTETPKQSQKKPSATDVRKVRSLLDVLFPDAECNTTFNAAWKSDVANHPDQYPQVMQALSVALAPTPSTK